MDGERSLTHRLDPANPIHMGVVNAVAVMENVRPIDLPPLHDVVDPERLEALRDAPADGQRKVEFDYCGYAVTVRSDRTVTLEPLGDSP